MTTRSIFPALGKAAITAVCGLFAAVATVARADTITATATNSLTTQPKLSITAQASQGYGVGYLSIVDGAKSPLSGVNIWGPAFVAQYWVGWGYTNPVNFTWTDPRPVYGIGTKTYTVYSENYMAGINPGGWGFVATTVTSSYNITGNPIGSNLVLSAPSYTLVSPAQPAFHISVYPLNRTNSGDGSTALDYLQTAYIDIPGFSTQSLAISSPYATFTANFADPRGALPQLTPITYHVRIYGAEMVPNSGDNYDDNGDYVDTSYWFDWNWHDMYTADISFQFTDPRTSQTITFVNPGPHALGDASFPLSASSSSGLPISWLSSGPVSISGTTATITGAGTVTITAIQGGNATYKPAPNVVQSFTVAKGTPTVTFADPGPFPSQTAWNIASAVTSNSDGAITFSVTSGNATIGLGLISMGLNATAVIRATVAATANWNSAYAERTITSTTGVTNTMSAVATNALNQSPSFAITATSIGSYSNGYYVVYVYDNGQDPGSNSTGAWVPGGYIDSFSVAWTGPGVFRWNWKEKRSLFGTKTKTYTFLAMSLYNVNPGGWGYNGTSGTTSYSISGNPTLGNIVLSAPSTNLFSPVQLGFHIAVTPAISYTADNQSAADQIYQTKIDTPGLATQTINNPAYPSGSVSVDFVDPRGSFTGTQNVNYHVHVYGVQMVPYANDVYDDSSGDYLYTDYGFSGNWIDPLYQADISFQLTDSRIAQTISLGNPGQQTYGVAPITLTASATSGLPVSLSVVAGPATLAGTTLTITGAGSVSLKASQPGNATYQAAPDVTQTFVVVPGTPIVTFNDPGSIPFNASTPLVGYVTSSLPATSGWTWSVTSGSASVDAGGNVVMTGPAVIRATVNATPGASSAYSERSLTVGNASPIQLALQYWQANDAPYQTSSTAYSYTGVINQAAYDAGPSTWYLYNVYEPNGAYYGQAWNWDILNWYSYTVYNIVDAGSYGASWTTSQGGFQIGSSAAAFKNSPNRGNLLNTYNPGNTFSFTPFGYAPSNNLGSLSWQFIDPNNNVLQTGSMSNYAGAYNYGANVKQYLSQNGLYQIVLSYSGATATGSDPSSASVTYYLPVGVLSPTITFSVPNHYMGDAPFNLTSSSTGGGSPTYSIVSQTPSDGSGAGMITLSGSTITILKSGTAQLSVTYAASPPWTSGTATATLTVNKTAQMISFGALSNKVFGDAPFTIAATASSGLPVTFTSTGPVTVSGNVVTITGGGAATIFADQSGNATYSPAPTVSQGFTVAKAAATLTLGNLSQVYTGSPLSASTVTSPAGLPATITYNGSTTAPTNVGSYAVVATINSPNYQGSASGTLTISKANPAITWNTPAAISYGTPLSATQLNATANTAGVWVYSPAAGTILNTGPNQSLSVSLTPTDTTNFNTATANTTINVTQITQSINFPNPGKVYVGVPATMSATASSGLAITFSVTSGTASLSGNSLTASAAGTVTVLASQAGNANYAAASSSQSFPALFNYVLTVNPGANGSVLVSGYTSTAGAGSYNFDSGSSALLTPSPVAGWRFLGWSLVNAGPIVSVSNPLTLTMNSSATYFANWQKIWTISLTANPAAGGTVSGGGSADDNTIATVAATPAGGWRFQKWTGPDAGLLADSNSPSTTVPVNKNLSLTANFVQQWTLSVNATAGGTASGGGVFDDGSVVPLSASPSANNAFAGWSGAAVADANNASTTIALTNNASVTANFAPTSAGGTIDFGSAYLTNALGYSPTWRGKTATVSNGGNSMLSVSRVTYSAEFSASASSLSVANSSSGNVVVTFVPSGIGLRTGTVSFFSNDSTRSAMSFTVTGTGMAAAANPPTVSAARIGSGTLHSGDALPFTVSGVSSLGLLTKIGFILVAPDNSQSAPSYYTPGGTAGSISYNFSVTLGATSGTYTVLCYAEDSMPLNSGWVTGFAVSVSPATTQQTINSMAVPAPGLEIWFTPSPVNSATYTIQKN